MSDFEHHGNDPDDTTLLASAYLDDEATPDERALVETSPEALAVVADFGNVRTVLGATAPEASLSEREGHLATALDVWGRMSALERSGEVTPSDGLDAAAAAAVMTPLDGTRRGRPDRPTRAGAVSMPQWVLGAAAALVMIAGIGAVVLGDVTLGDQASIWYNAVLRGDINRRQNMQVRFPQSKSTRDKFPLVDRTPVVPDPVGAGISFFLPGSHVFQ